MADIEMTRRLLAIGRRELPFAEYPKAALAKLSKRHARLLVEGTTAYVVDLDSLNGSAVNGITVTNEPVALQDGDELSFGGLKYSVHWVAPPVDNARAAAGQLILKPVAHDSQLEAAVLSNFPQLVNKHSELFAQVADPQARSYLSRSHAQLLRLGDEFHIEDLGSTNGTYVNGQNIEEHVRQLAEGDVIGFGGELLQYRVYFHEVAPAIADDDETVLEVTQLQEVSEPAPEVSAVLDSSRTIFVDSATSFLNVYFNDSDDKPAQQHADAPPPVAASAAQQTVPKAIAGTLFGGTGVLRRLLAVLGSVVLIGALLVTYRYWSGNDLRQVTALQEAEEYEQALALGNGLLAEHPQDERLQTLVTSALLQTLLVPWSAAHESADLQAMSSLVLQAQQNGSHNVADDGLLELLDWAGTVRGYLDVRRRSGDPFEQARRVGELLQYWTEDQNQRSRDLRTLLDADSGFERSHSQIFADVRRLRSLDLDGERWRELAATLREQLPRGNANAVRELVSALFDSQPGQPGVDLLRSEVDTYATLQTLVSEQQWVQAAGLLSSVGFQTAPFRDYGSGLQRDQLPSEQFLEDYQQAVDLWRAGRFEDSEQALSDLTPQQWGNVAQQRLQIQRQRLADWQQLSAMRGAPDYARRLFDFYASLDHGDDLGLIDQLRPDFMSHSKDALREAARTLARAAQAWRRYQDAGGIQTEHRLRAEIGSTFTNLAALLGASLGDLDRGLQIYGQVGVAPSQNWLGLQEQLLREVAVQRSALSNLQVLSPAVREGKLALLPTTSPESSSP
ncbi:MAG: FHA domain-containing protein [Pseudomonadales bacterium]